MQQPNQPALGSKEGPAASDVKAAQQAKQQTEMTLSKYHALVTNIGVFSYKWDVGPEGIHIEMRARHDFGDGDKIIKVDVLCPKGHPFPLYAMQAYEEMLQVVEGRAMGKTEEDRAVMPTEPPPLPSPAPPPPTAPSAPVISGSVRKAPGMPAPKRTPINQGLCKREGCPQPVAWPGHDHCSPTCARADFVERAAKKAGIALPEAK